MKNMKETAKDTQKETQKEEYLRDFEMEDEIRKWFFNRLNQLLAVDNYSIRTFSQLTGVSSNTINNLIYNKSIPSLRTVFKICSGFGISVSDFFSDIPFTEIRVVTEEEYCIVIEYRTTKPDNKYRLLYTWAKLNGKEPEDILHPKKQ